MPNVQFSELKMQVPILDVATGMLGLQLTMRISQPKDGGKPYETHRGRCPICKYDKVFTVTPGSGWYCHGRCKTGGDVIKLVAAMRHIEPREAALQIQEHFGSPSPTVNRPRDSGNADRSIQLENVLKRLQPEHEAIQALGVSPETARLFESGYNPSGVQKGRYSVAIRDFSGQLVTFAGIAVDHDQQPQIAFSNFDPASLLFNAHRLAGSDLLLHRSPLDAIIAVENNAPIESVTSFLTETVSPHQLEMLASLMDEKKLENLWL